MNKSIPYSDEDMEEYSRAVQEKRHGVTSKCAMDALRVVMHQDPEYAYAWHSSIAMSFYDAMRKNHFQSAHVIANEAAARFMKMAFNADTSADMLDGDKQV